MGAAGAGFGLEAQEARVEATMARKMSFILIVVSVVKVAGNTDKLDTSETA